MATNQASSCPCLGCKFVCTIIRTTAQTETTCCEEFMLHVFLRFKTLLDDFGCCQLSAIYIYIYILNPLFAIWCVKAIWILVKSISGFSDFKGTSCQARRDEHIQVNNYDCWAKYLQRPTCSIDFKLYWILKTRIVLCCSTATNNIYI